MTAIDLRPPRRLIGMRVGMMGLWVALSPLAALAQSNPASKPFLDEAREATSADRYLDALAAYAQAIAAAPDDPAAYSQRAYLFELLGQPALAARDYRVVVHDSPANVGAQNRLCLYLAQTNHDLDGALVACNAAVHLAPMDPSMLGTRGYLHLRRGDYQKAEKDYQAALDQAPASPDEMFGLGVAQIHLGEVREGREQIASATLDSAGLVQQWEARGFGLQGEVIAGPPAKTASQPAISALDRRVFRNADEAFVQLADGCGRIVPAMAAGHRAAITQQNASLSWSGECRFGLAHGEGRLTAAAEAGGPVMRFAYGREIKGADGATLEQKLDLAYQAAEKAVLP